MLIKKRNGTALVHWIDTATYWVITRIGSVRMRLFAGCEADRAECVFARYADAHDLNFN